MAKKTAANPNDFILPDLGEGVHEAELIKWRVQVGQPVEEHDILAEMETDKALVEVPSPRKGVIARLWGEEGQILKVGEPLVSYEGAGGAEADDAQQPARAEPAGEAAESAAKSNGTHKPGRGGEEAEAERADAGTVVGTMSGALAGVSGGGKALATPAVRRLARDLGIDINLVPGTGIGGRVTEKDVRAFGGGGDGDRAQGAARPAARAPAPMARAGGRESEAGTSAPPRRTDDDAAIAAALRADTGAAPAPRGRTAPPDERIPFRGVRRTIANRLRHSVSTAVHFTAMDEADVTALDVMRKRVAAASGEKVSFLPFVVAAVCRALRQYPALNATVDDEHEEILRHHSIHMGVATDTEHGLTVPVLPDADAMGVLELGRSITALAASSRDRSIPREQLMGSTFTVSNVGSYAGRFATPVINYPEVAILAVGRVHEGVVVKNGGMHVAKLMPLSLACDHRVVDGAEGVMFLAKVMELLQTPDDLLAPARG